MFSHTSRVSLAASFALLALMACRDTSSPVDPLDESARLAVTPPPPPLDEFSPGSDGGLVCDPTSGPAILDWYIPLPAKPRLLVSGSGSSAMLQLRSQLDPGKAQSTFSNGAFLQERNGAIVSGRGEFTIIPYNDIDVPLYGNLTNATGTLTQLFLGVRRIAVNVPVTPASGPAPEFVCSDNPNVRFRIVGASLLLEY
jgi:hypothetical protein